MPLIKFHVKNTQLRQYNSVVVAANTSARLQLQFIFLTADWSAVSAKKVFLTYGERVEEFKLNEHNQIYVPDRFIYAPQFSVSLFGDGITTNTVIIPVVGEGVPDDTPPVEENPYDDILQQLSNIGEQIIALQESNVELGLIKADNLRYNSENNTLQLVSGETVIGDLVKLNTGSVDAESLDVLINSIVNQAIKDATNQGCTVVEFSNAKSNAVEF